MGRPVLQEDEKRMIQVNIRLTVAENEKLVTYAQAAGISPANWLRQKAFTGRFPTIKLSPVQAELYRELHKIGVNLNQAVKQVHSGKLPAVYLTILGQLSKTLKDVLNCLLQ